MEERLLVEPRLTSCLVWSSDGSILANVSLLHRVNYEFVLCSVHRQTTLEYRSSNIWMVPNKYCTQRTYFPRLDAGKYSLLRVTNTTRAKARWLR